MFNLKNLSAYAKRKGFSLPETLITMSIIGVVFSLTAGVMIADYQRNYTGIRLKQIYVTIEQAFRGAAAFHSNPVNWVFPEDNSAEASYVFFSKYLKPYLQLFLDCKNSSDNGCDYTIKQLNGEDKPLHDDWTRFFLNDGSFAAMQLQVNPNEKVVFIFVDVNGKKRLNVVGRDIFLFQYYVENTEKPELIGKLLPYGYDKTRDELVSGDQYKCSKEGNGFYCAALIINDGWQIKQGYPWTLAKYAISAEETASH